jgi:hypothetical protein
MTRPSLLVNQAAAHAGISRRTMYYWIATGKVESFKTRGQQSTRVYIDKLPERVRRPRSSKETPCQA